MSEDAVAEFSAAIENVTGAVEDACAMAVIEFAKYVGANWKMSESEWRRTYAEEPPTGSYWDGYNAAVDAMEGAAAFFTGRDLR